MKVRIHKEYLAATWKGAIRDKFFVVFNIINFLITVGLFVFLYYMFGFAKEASVVLHYNIYFGVDLVGEWHRVFYIFYLAAAIFIINLLLSGFVYLRERTLVIFLTLGTFFCLILLSVASLLIVLINS